MRTYFLLLVSVLAVLSPLLNPRALQGQTKQPVISSPVPGQVLQGSIPIVVDTNLDGFQSAAVYFSYSNDPTQTWFLIQTSDASLSNTALAQWDTTTITDGDYSLRLVVNRQKDVPLETVIKGLRVRNYSPVETDTPAPATQTPTPTPGPVLTSTPTPVTPTATPLPTNPAEMTSANIMDSMGRGALAVLAIFLLLGIYVGIRALKQANK